MVIKSIVFSVFLFEVWTLFFQELNGSCERLSGEEYVRILNDVIHINKNLCVARYFSRLDKDLPRYHFV